MTNDLKINIQYDLIVLGGGAAGLFSAIHAARGNKRILILEGNKTVGKKIRISGGGRCNFTNKRVSYENFYSKNHHFVKSSLTQYTNDDFIQFVKKHRIDFYEKKKGQLFCKESSTEIISMLLKECQLVGVEIKTSEEVVNAIKSEDIFVVKTKHNQYWGKNIIVATGGLSMKAIGATDIGYRLAKSFGHEIIMTRPGLVPLKLKGSDLELFSKISGVSLPVSIKTSNKNFEDDLLFTHRGLSGPSILQCSSLWEPGEKLEINFCPNIMMKDLLIKEKRRAGHKKVEKFVSTFIPSRLTYILFSISKIDQNIYFREISDKKIKLLGEMINKFIIFPSGYESMNKAEVTIGGVSTKNISSKTMESKIVKGLYFIGEVLDVSGQLGGFNFQWAWSSGYVAGKSIV